jgi:hypothetical protein
VLLVDDAVAPLGVLAVAPGRALAEARLDAGLQRLTVELADCPGACPVELRFDRELAADADRRPRSARIYGAWCEGPAFDVPAYAFSPGLPSSAAGRGVRLEGFYPPERFTKTEVPGAWTSGDARADFYAGTGRVEVTLAQPPPRDPTVTLQTDAGSWTVRAGAAPTTHIVDIDGDDERAWLRIVGEARVPAHDNPQSNDQRPLGPIVFSIAYVPADDA